MQHDFNSTKEVKLDVVEKILDLLDLDVRWLQDVWGASEVVNNSNAEDLEDHLMLDVSSDLVIFDCFLELGD